MVRQVLARIFHCLHRAEYSAQPSFAPLTEHLAEVSSAPSEEGLFPPGSGGDLGSGRRTGPPETPSVRMFRSRARVSDAALTCLLLGACFSVSVLNCGDDQCLHLLRWLKKLSDPLCAGH